MSCGYPACAGIDPNRGALDTRVPRLPRMRGDRPHTRQPAIRAEGATPHARGSTLANAVDQARYCGYPACAGIDPAPPLLTARPIRLPRMRGDRPSQLSSVANVRAATPHARGSTVRI